MSAKNPVFLLAEFNVLDSGERSRDLHPVTLKEFYSLNVEAQQKVLWLFSIRQEAINKGEVK